LTWGQSKFEIDKSDQKGKGQIGCELKKNNGADHHMSREKATATPRSSIALLITILLIMPLVTSGNTSTGVLQDEEGKSPDQLWSTDYQEDIFPWAERGDDRLQFKAYHDYFTMKERMMRLAEDNPGFISFHEGLPGGTNARGEERGLPDFQGHFYKHASPWVKITANVEGGEYNPYVGDRGNYADRPDVMLVGNHHAREWMSYEVPMLFLETVAYYYGKPPIDNDGDGREGEDSFGDTNNDGELDDDGDCLSLSKEFRDSNGDGKECGPGDHGVDEDFKEQWITDLVDTREIYLIPMLNVDGNRYDREVFCGEDAWNCDEPGWRKNLRDNTVEGRLPLPDLDEEVNSGCDGVDLNRNYEFEWGAPLGATGPLFPGDCYAGTGVNNDVYNGPPDGPFDDEDGDGLFNEDDVDDNNDDGDDETDEDPLGGNTEPETMFIQDMTEMNDDNDDGASDFKATLTWHSFSGLVLWPWGHCTDCAAKDETELIYHGNVMAQYTGYEAKQSSALYPTTGDFCDWHYGVHDSFCYTIEIGNAFHEHPDDIDHLAVLNLGVPFWMIEISDDPVGRAQNEIQGMPKNQTIMSPDHVPLNPGPIPIDICIHPLFPYSSNGNLSHVMWRFVRPNRTQSDYGPNEWFETPWAHQHVEKIEMKKEKCTLLNGENGTILRGNIPIEDDLSGELHYKGMLGTLSGAFPYTYPMGEKDAKGNGIDYYEIVIPYRAPYGNTIIAFAMFLAVVILVWGGLGISLKTMFSLDEEEPEGREDLSEEIHDEESDELDKEPVSLRYSERTLERIATTHGLEASELIDHAQEFDTDENGYLNATELTAAAKSLKIRLGKHDADLEAALDEAA